jgi:hypothetical protein
MAHTHACFLITLQVSAQQITSYNQTEALGTIQHQTAVNQIVLEANRLDIFNVYNTNGTAPNLSCGSAVFSGSNKTDMYKDIVSRTAIKAEKTVILEVSATTYKASQARAKTNLQSSQPKTLKNSSQTSLASFCPKQATLGTLTFNLRRCLAF